MFQRRAIPENELIPTEALPKDVVALIIFFPKEISSWV